MNFSVYIDYVNREIYSLHDYNDGIVDQCACKHSG